MKTVSVLRKASLILMMGLISQTIISEAHAQELSWTTKTDVPITSGSGRNYPLTMSIGGKVYVGGGNVAPGGVGANDFYAFDTVTGAWTAKANLPGAANRSAGVAFSAGGKGYVGLGISNYFGAGATYLNDMWEYDPVADDWTAMASLPDTGRGTGGYFVVDGKVYVVGGQITPAGGKTAKVWEFNPATDTWTAKASFPGGPVTYPFAFSNGSKGYISSGTQGGAVTKATYEYDPVANTWTAKANFPGSKTSGGVAFTINGKSFCGLGNIGAGAATDTFYAYDPVTNTWSEPLTSFTGGARTYGVATVIGSRAYVGCGWGFDMATSSQTFYSDWYKVFDSSVSTTGLGDVSASAGIGLYPNPAHSTLNISVNDKNVTTGGIALYNLVGREIFATNWLKGTPVDINSVPEGLYIAKLTVGNNNYFKRVMVGN